MVTTAEPQTFAFQAEIQRLLHLLAHSLYQSREIAIRELISNASDALDKMRYVALTEEAFRDAGPFEIRIEGRKDEGTLAIVDNGVGMTRDELVTNLGTIAHSGSLEFLKGLAQSQAQARDGRPDLSLIGQFGVGFYSAFMLADRVEVRTRSYREDAGWAWESDGGGSFSVRSADVPGRGTRVLLHLKDDARDLADPSRIAEVIRRYSSFVPHPIRVDDKVVNELKPIWVEPRNQVTPEQHATFYQHLSHHADEAPLWYVHQVADSPIQFRAVLYCPRMNVEALGLGRIEHGLSLCAKRVLVQSDCRELLPEYLRFLYGLVDSEDLPLNVSRETLQDNGVIRRIRTSLVRAVFDRLNELGEKAPEDYLAFYRQFGPILREGIATDFENREKIARLLRFASSHADDPAKPTSLDDYLKRAKPEQGHIYYAGGPDLGSIRKSPNLEIFRRKGVEVIYLTDPIDEFVVSSLQVFAGKPLTSIDSAELDLPGDEGKDEAKPADEPPTGELGRVVALFREALGDRVQDVKVSKRLVDSPCCLVTVDGGFSTQMQKLLKLNNKEIPITRKALEINAEAPLIRRLTALVANPDHHAFVKEVALQLWSNALILEGLMPEPEAMVGRLQSMMEQAAASRSVIIH